MPPVSAPALLRALAHRPYPLPERPWLGLQTWSDLLLAHWPVRASDLRPLIPEPLQIDTYEGAAWVSIVPFRMEHVRLRGVPRACGLTFPELNVRTYVSRRGHSGVFFFSLDATNRAAVLIGRRLFGLPYSLARITMERGASDFSFASERLAGGGAFTASYCGGAPIRSAPDSLDHFLTERYCFYSLHGDGRVLRCDIHHRPWPLQQATATLSRMEPGSALHALNLGAPPALVRYSPGVDVLFWRAQAAG